MGIPIGEIGGLLRNLGGGAAKLLQKDYLSGALRAGVSPRGFLNNELGPMQTVKAWANTRQMQIGPAAGGVAAAAMTSPSFTTGIQNALNQVGPAIDRTVSNIVPDNLENWAGRTAREMEKGGLLGMVEGAVTAPFVAVQTYGQKGGYNTPSPGGSALNGIQTGKYGRTDWNPSANPSIQQGSQQAADRAYQSQVSSIAQQTVQNPLFQKYQVADLTKQYNTAANPAEKQRIGLEIWAQTNPLLAAKLKSGQVGYTESRSAPGMSNAGGLPIGGLPMPTTQFNAATDVSTPGTMEQTFGTPVPGYGMVSATPMVFNPGAPQGPITDGMIQASYGQQLLTSPDFAKAAKDSMFLRRAYQQQGLK